MRGDEVAFFDRTNNTDEESNSNFCDEVVRTKHRPSTKRIFRNGRFQHRRSLYRRTPQLVTSSAAQFSSDRLASSSDSSSSLAAASSVSFKGDAFDEIERRASHHPFGEIRQRRRSHHDAALLGGALSRRAATESRNYVHRSWRLSGVWGSALLAFKRVIIKRGVFGHGRRAKVAEVFAFLVYCTVIAVSINWVAVYAYLYFNSGWLGNLTTTFATYRSLEAPSLVVCRSATAAEILKSQSKAVPWVSSRDTVYVQLWQYGKLYMGRFFFYPCSRLGPNCSCLDTWKLDLYDKNVTRHDRVVGPHMLRDILHAGSLRPDTIRFSIYTPASSGVQENSSLKVGIYDSKLKAELGDQPAWIDTRTFHSLSCGVSLVRSWVIDPHRIEFLGLLKGEFAHGEHTFLVDLDHAASFRPKRLQAPPALAHQQNADREAPDKKEATPGFQHGQQVLLKLEVRYSSYTVVEVWRVGVSVSLALVGLTAVCVSTFNKLFIFNTLFPYYDAEESQKLQLTAFARAVTCGYFGAKHPK